MRITHFGAHIISIFQHLLANDLLTTFTTTAYRKYSETAASHQNITPPGRQ